MSDSKILPKQEPKRNRMLNLIIIIAVTLGVLIVGWFLYIGIPYLFPKPLTLKPTDVIKARVTIDTPGPFHIGDLVPITLSVESRTGVTYSIPELVGTDSNSFEIKHKSIPVWERRLDGQVQKVHYLITGWTTGIYKIKTFTVPYQNRSKKDGFIRVPGRTFTIVSILPLNKSKDELLKLDVKGLKGPVSLPPRYDLLWWCLGGIVVLILIWLLIQTVRKMATKKETQNITNTMIAEPAHIVALRQLTAIQNMDYLAKGDFKTYYSELSECIREYMENRYQIRALEMTTEEFLNYVSTNQDLKLEFQLILKDFLNSSDLVKFAKHLPLIAEAQHSLAIVHQFIEATKEIPLVEPDQITGVPPTPTKNLEEQVS